MKNADFGKPIAAFTQFVPGRIHFKDHLRQRSLLWGEPSDSAKNAANVAYWRQHQTDMPGQADDVCS
jgi:hypothetical protein